MKMAISGGTGFVGGHRTRALILESHQVALISRSWFALARIFRKNVEVGTPRCGVPAPCRRGTGASLSDGFVTLATECSAAERGGDGAARHPYLCFAALGRNGCEICGLAGGDA
jgi:hypothetical protein